jgi:hypothetical protein
VFTVRGLYASATDDIQLIVTEESFQVTDSRLNILRIKVTNGAFWFQNMGYLLVAEAFIPIERLLRIAEISE